MTHITKNDKKELYKSIYNNNVFKIYEINEKQSNSKAKFDINIENITKCYSTILNSNTSNNMGLLLNSFISSTLLENIEDFEETNYLLLSLSPIWNYIFGTLQTQFNKHTSITWSSSTNRIIHTNIKFGTKTILFIDRLTKDNINKLLNIFKLCIKNGLKYNTLVVLFYDEDGYEELLKYHKPTLNIIPLLKLSLLINYYEKEKLINDYQVESVKFQQETTYNSIIKELKNEHRINAKTFNYQSKHAKYLCNNKHLLNLLNIYNIKLNLDGLDFIKYFKNTKLTDTEIKKITNNLDKFKSQTDKQNAKQKQLQHAQITKYNTLNKLIENITVSFDYSKLIIDGKFYKTYDNINKLLTTLISIKNNYSNNINFNIVIDIELLQNITQTELVSIIEIKDKYNFGFILDIPSYKVSSINLNETTSISKDIIKKYNLDDLLVIKNNYKLNFYNNYNNYNTNKNIKYRYNSFTDIIDNVILTINADTFERFNKYLELFKSIREHDVGIIICIDKDNLNINNYLSNQQTWNLFNEFLVEETSKNNVNITGLINNDNFKFNNFELSKALSIIYNFSNIEFKDNELLLKTKKNNNMSLFIINEYTFINNTKPEILNNFINTITLDTMKFKKEDINKNKEDYDLNKINDNLDNINTNNSDKNKELLEDEDEYSKIQILYNILSRLNILSNVLQYNIDKNNIDIYNLLYCCKNKYLTWFNNSMDEIKNTTPILDYIKTITLIYVNKSFDITLTYITSSFDIINLYFFNK